MNKLVELLEQAVNLRGSPKGYGASHPIPEKNIKPVYGQSEYPLQDLPDEEPKKVIKVSKHLEEKEEEEYDNE